MARCRDFFQEVRSEIKDFDSFYSGFVLGNLEKVWIDSCPACVFRPEKSEQDTCLNIITKIATKFNLKIAQIDRDIWVYKHNNIVNIIKILTSFSRHSDDWHIIRGYLCGINASNINVKYTTHD